MASATYIGTKYSDYAGQRCTISRRGQTISKVFFADGFHVAVWNKELKF